VPVTSRSENQTRSDTVGAVLPSPVVVRDLSVAYDGRTVLSGVDLEVPAGTTLAVIGPNGSGKSTLLHAMAGLVPLRSGSVTLDGSRVALVLQSTDVDRSVPITVRDTVAMARYPSTGLLGRFRSEDREAVRSAMERTDVAGLAGRVLHDLSGGQRQRVLVAQGLAQEAEVLLLDEPVTGLDMRSRRLILEAVAAERAAGRAVVMTTHSLDDARSCDRVVLLDSRPVAVGTPDEVLREDNLRSAFGGHLFQGEGHLLMDDPHHVH
jgi:iron complex transport system ATP-binding protein